MKSDTKCCVLAEKSVLQRASFSPLITRPITSWTDGSITLFCKVPDILTLERCRAQGYRSCSTFWQAVRRKYTGPFRHALVFHPSCEYHQSDIQFTPAVAAMSSFNFFCRVCNYVLPLYKGSLKHTAQAKPNPNCSIKKGCTRSVKVLPIFLFSN